MNKKQDNKKKEKPSIIKTTEKLAKDQELSGHIIDDINTNVSKLQKKALSLSKLFKSQDTSIKNLINEPIANLKKHLISYDSEYNRLYNLSEAINFMTNYMELGEKGIIEKKMLLGNEQDVFDLKDLNQKIFVTADNEINRSEDLSGILNFRDPNMFVIGAKGDNKILKLISKKTKLKDIYNTSGLNKMYIYAKTLNMLPTINLNKKTQIIINVDNNSALINNNDNSDITKEYEKQEQLVKEYIDIDNVIKMSSTSIISIGESLVNSNIKDDDKTMIVNIFYINRFDDIGTPSLELASITRVFDITTKKELISWSIKDSLIVTKKEFNTIMNSLKELQTSPQKINKDVEKKSDEVLKTIKETIKKKEKTNPVKDLKELKKNIQ